MFVIPARGVPESLRHPVSFNNVPIDFDSQPWSIADFDKRTIDADWLFDNSDFVIIRAENISGKLLKLHI